MEGQSLVLPAARDAEGQNAQEQVEHEAVDRPVRAWQPAGPYEHLPRRTLDRQEQVADEIVGSEIAQEESRETQVKIRGLVLRTKRPAKQEQTKHRDRQGISAEQGRRFRRTCQGQRKGESRQDIASQTHESHLPGVRLVSRNPACTMNAAQGDQHHRHRV